MRTFITLTLLTALSCLSFFSPTDFEVKGKITDASDGNPVAGATISTKNSKVATVSSNDGTFSIRVPDNTRELVISAVGYNMKNVKVKPGTGNLSISLSPSSNALEEVEVAGISSAADAAVVLQGATAGMAITRKRAATSSAFGNEGYNTEDYDAVTENRFLEASSTPLSTFSIDVDGASYSNVRRFLNQGQLPPAGSVRVEEMINYFRYNYPQPASEHPFSITSEVSECPWNPDHQLVLIGLQGKKVDTRDLPASNLVFLIDVSGSMMDENKLPLVKSSLKLLVEQLREQDHVSMVVYAGNAGLVLPSTSGREKQKIIDAIQALEAGGSTAGGEGIRLAYREARKQFIREGNNRVILCTDGDFNVGVSSDAELVKLIEQERASGIFLTVLGYGMGNYKDNKMQKLADKGNGNHSYIDNINEARKVLVNEFGGTLFTIAKDVKLQVEFNPAKVQAYRLVGYENRMLNKEDFNNDQKDAGEIGSGHSVTALYEVIPAGVKSKWIEKTDELKYQSNKSTTSYSGSEMMNVKFRYKKPDGSKSIMFEHPIAVGTLREPSGDFRFVAAVAQYGMLLNNSEFRQNSSFANARRLAQAAVARDAEGYRKEFLELIAKAEELMQGVGKK